MRILRRLQVHTGLRLQEYAEKMSVITNYPCCPAAELQSARGHRPHCSGRGSSNIRPCCPAAEVQSTRGRRPHFYGRVDSTKQPGCPVAEMQSARGHRPHFRGRDASTNLPCCSGSGNAIRLKATVPHCSGRDGDLHPVGFKTKTERATI